MALNLGELAATLSLDGSKFDDGLDESESKFKGFGSKLKASALLIGAAAGAALAAGLAQALDVEKANDRMAAQLRLTEEESERAGGVAGALYADAYGANIGEVNDALRGIIAQTGEMGDITDAELSSMGAAALDLAAIYGQDVTRVIQVAGQAVRNGLADNMTEAFDLIAAASAETMPGLEADLLDAADEYGIFFSQLGIDGPQAFGMLAKGSEQGMYGIDKAGDAIKEFTIRAADMSTGATEAYEAIGLDAEEMAAKILAGGDTAKGGFDQIISGLLAMEDPVAQQTAALALFGTPLEDLSTAQIPEFLGALASGEDALGDISGAAAEAGDTLNDNTATGFESLKRSAMDSLMSAMEPMIPILVWLIEVLDPIAPVLGILAVALGIAAAATWVFNSALWANPIVWIIAAVIALAAAVWLIVDNWDAVSAWLVGAWDWIKEQASAIFSAIGDFFVEWWPWIFAIFTGGGSLILAWIIDNWDEIKEVTSNVFGAIADFFVMIWDAIVESIRIQVQMILSAIDWFKNLPGKIAGWFGAVKDAAVEKLVALVSWVKGLPGRITSALGNIKDLLLSKGSDVITGLLNGMKNAAGAIKDWLMGLLQGLGDSVKDFFGIASPSKLMTGYGEFIGEGLALGLRRSVGGIQVATGELTAAALPIDLTSTTGPARIEATTSLSDEDRSILRELAEARNRFDIRTDANTRVAEIRRDAMVVG